MPDDPKQIHEWDQSMAWVRTLAGYTGTFYRELLEQGIVPSEASLLTDSFIRSWLDLVRPKPPESA